MKLFSSQLCRPIKTSRRARLTLERLEGRELPSVSPPPILSIAEAEYKQDNSALTRTDVIDLFDTAAGTKKAIFSSTGAVAFDNVKNPNLSTPLPVSTVDALDQIFVTESNQWGLAADVANLAGKVAGQNQANEHYQGAALLKSGLLAAGDPARDLTDLVGKWFYGSDLPAINVGGACYQNASGTLFGLNGPKASDVAQGDVGDCYFLSSLAETALQSPQTIEQMFANYGDGTYTVRFYEYDSTTKSFVSDYVTVNSKLPASSTGLFVYANDDFQGHSTKINNTANVLWVALAEKAYAQLAEEGWSRPSHVNAYSSINIGDNLTASQQITGSAYAKWMNFQNGNSANEKSTIETLATDFQSGDVITICTKDQKMTVSGLDDNHVYYVTGVDTKNMTVTITNPYWNNGTKTLTLSFKNLVNNVGNGNTAVVGTTTEAS
jgi:hypothetical protein